MFAQRANQATMPPSDATPVEQVQAAIPPSDATPDEQVQSAIPVSHATSDGQVLKRSQPMSGPYLTPHCYITSQPFGDENSLEPGR